MVIAIIGILASLLLPALASAKSKAHATYCRNNLRQIGIGLLSYTSEHSDFPAYVRLGSASEPPGSKWYNDITPDLPGGLGNRMYRCPSYRGPIDNVYGSYAYNSGSVDNTGRYLYGLSGILLDRDRLGAYAAANVKVVREAEIQNPSDMIALGDSLSRYCPPLSPWWDASPHWLGGGNGTLSRRSPYLGTYPYTTESGQHRGRANTTFADGHVEGNTLQNLFFSLEEKWLRKWHTDNEPHKEFFQ